MRVSRLFWWAAVVAMFCVPLFVGLGRTDLGNDEAIYSYAVESILETGDWLNPRSSPDSGSVFVEKPPLKFWIVALPIRLGLLPNDEFGLRFWDAVFGSVAFLYVFAIGRRLGGGLCGWIACLVLFGFHPLLFDHGLRSNNMEAALLLSYCGGVYHYLRWTDSPAPPGARGTLHVLAIGACFFLGFMTKFVAIAFLPMVLGLASLLIAPVRRQLQASWRVWLGTAVFVVVLAAPWFLYEMTRGGRGLWTVMLVEHVYLRFSASLDPDHVQPWDYYLSFLSLFLHQERIYRTAVFAGLVGLVQTVRTRWIDGTVVLLWFAVPLALISLGTSKLGHYAYPFLPPIGLAVGYLLSSVLRLALALAAGEPLLAAVRDAWLPPDSPRPPREQRSSWLDGVASRASAFLGNVRRWSAPVSSWRPAAWAWLVVRVVLCGLAAAWLLMAVIALVRPGRLVVFGHVLARHPRPLTLAVNAFLAGIVAGQARWALRLCIPVAVIGLAPVTTYHEILKRLPEERHPLHSVSACLADVRKSEAAAGRPTRNLFVFLPEGFVHPYFFYLRAAGWDAHERLTDEELRQALGSPGPPRPILISGSAYRAAWQPQVGTATDRVASIVTNDVVLLLPGPFERCAPDQR